VPSTRALRWVAAVVALVAVVLVGHQVFLGATARQVPVGYFARFDCTHAPLVFAAREPSGAQAGQVEAQGKVGPPKGRYCTVETVLPVHGDGPWHVTVALAATPDRTQDLGTFTSQQLAANDDFTVGAHRTELGPPGTTFICPYTDPAACAAAEAAGP
jgi:hypothetical protein